LHGDAGGDDHLSGSTKGPRGLSLSGLP
jgi:hypothetical protein